MKFYPNAKFVPEMEDTFINEQTFIKQIIVCVIKCRNS